MLEYKFRPHEQGNDQTNVEESILRKAPCDNQDDDRNDGVEHDCVEVLIGHTTQEDLDWCLEL
eukprot:XP_001709158.1 Hypothetical protein GL50803_21754 [Giardia lamblia ATCC 50803]